MVYCLAVSDCLWLALFLPSEQYFHYLDEKCICSSKMQCYKSYALGVQATFKVLSRRQTVTHGHRNWLYIWVRLPFFFSAELLLARLMTYFPTPGDNVLLCKMPLNIPPSIFLYACGKVFSLRFPPAKVRKPVRNTCSWSACGIVSTCIQFVMGLCSLTAWSCGMWGGFLEGFHVRKTDCWFLKKKKKKLPK